MTVVGPIFGLYRSLLSSRWGGRGRWKASQRGQQPENHLVLERLAGAAEEIAKHLDPKPPEIVKSSYVAGRFGCTIKWVGEMVRRGEIPKSCIAPGSGSGKQWRFYRSKIDKWIDSKI